VIPTRFELMTLRLEI